MNSFFQSPRKLLLAAAVVLVALIAGYRMCGAGKANPSKIVIRMEGLPKTLNPLVSANGYSLHLAKRIFLSLGEPNPATLEMEPLLAKSIPVARKITDGPNKDCLAYDFEIKDAAKWDNGTPVTANDFVFTLKVILHPGLPESKVYHSYVEDIKAVEIDAANPKKFTVYLKKYYMLGLETLCQLPFLPAYAYDANNRLKDVTLEALMQSPVDSVLANSPNMLAFPAEIKDAKLGNDKNSVTGAGPYRLETLTDQMVVLVKKQNWWGDALVASSPRLGAFPERLEYRLVRDDAVIETMLKSGEIDLVVAANPTKFLEWKEMAGIKDSFDFSTAWYPQFTRLQINCAQPNLQDKRMRQALACALDYNYLLGTIYKNLGERTSVPIHPSQKEFNKNVQLRNFDVQKAKALLAEAGWTDSNGDGTVDKMVNGARQELTIELIYAIGTKVGDLSAENIKQTLHDAGINVNVVPLELAEVSNRTKNGTYDIAMYGNASFPRLPELYQNFHSSQFYPNGDNRSRYSNPVADSLLVAIRTTEDPAARQKYYDALQVVFNEDLPDIYLYAIMQRYIVKNKYKPVLTSNRPGYYEQQFSLK